MTAPAATERRLTIPDAAVLLGVKPRVIYDWIYRGRLRHERFGNRIVVHRDDLYDTELATRQRDRSGQALVRTRT